MIVTFLEFLARLAPLGTLFVALTAIFIAYNQLKTARQNEAKKQYLSYLDECVKNPDMASGIITDENMKMYIWFTTKCFMAHESLLAEYPDDVYWKRAMVFHLYPHILNLVSEGKEDIEALGLNSYSPEFQKFMMKIVADISSQQINNGGKND
jgi:chloramphenicol O-acetyltransferase